jgi:hypothetical protein
MCIFRRAGILTALAILGAGLGFAQFRIPGVNKDKDKEEQRREKEAKADAKNVVAYEKIKTYSLDKYQSDPEFRNAVDDAYDALLREHMAVALDNNLNRSSQIYAVHEDRFRLHEKIYDNLLVQDHVNRIGQRMVPADSEKVFAFRLIPDPTPRAETLATGTVYISTGMLSLLDNEAQVAYVLAHEMAHVQLDHWREKVMLQRGVEAYNADQTKKAEHAVLLGSLIGAGIGGATGRAGNVFAGATTGALAGTIVGALMNRAMVVQWDKAQEDEADKMAFKYVLGSQLDVREVPKLYLAVDTISARDSRATLGFLGQRTRLKQRRETAERLIQEAYKADIDLRLKNGGFVGDSAAHRNLMAELKRDNGIMAYYNDMFLVARKNLEEAVAIRENDPAAQYFLGKTLATIGRTPEERRRAESCFAKAAQYDDQMENFGSHLHYALMMMGDGSTGNNQQITTQLDTYVTDYAKYQVEYSKTLFLPPNIPTIHEYMRLYGIRTGAPSCRPRSNSSASRNHSFPEARSPREPRLWLLQ